MIIGSEKGRVTLNITVNVEILKHVTSFSYLWHIITDDMEIKNGDCEKYIQQNKKNINIYRDKHSAENENREMLCIFNTAIWCRDLDNEETIRKQK